MLCYNDSYLSTHCAFWQNIMVFIRWVLAVHLALIRVYLLCSFSSHWGCEIARGKQAISAAILGHRVRTLRAPSSNLRAPSSQLAYASFADSFSFCLICHLSRAEGTQNKTTRRRGTPRTPTALLQREPLSFRRSSSSTATNPATQSMPGRDHTSTSTALCGA